MEQKEFDKLYNKYINLLYKRGQLILKEMEKDNEEFFARHK